MKYGKIQTGIRRTEYLLAEKQMVASCRTIRIILHSFVFFTGLKGQPQKDTLKKPKTFTIEVNSDGRAINNFWGSEWGGRERCSTFWETSYQSLLQT